MAPKHPLTAESIERKISLLNADLALLEMKNLKHRITHGCLAEEVFRHVRCTCIVFGSGCKTERSVSSKDGPVLFATNFQEHSIRKLFSAYTMALALDKPLECVHVLPLDLKPTKDVSHIIPEIMRNALVDEAKRQGIPLCSRQCHIVYGREVAPALADLVNQLGAKILAMTVLRRPYFVSHLSAGIAISAIDHTKCPVAVFPVDPETGDN